MPDDIRLGILEDCREHYKRIIAAIEAGSPCLIDIWIDDERHGIENPLGCLAAIRGLLAEVERQIKELAA